MEIKDVIVIIISGAAIIISLVSLIVTFIQKGKETKRTIRKSLTDTLENISRINLETAKLSSTSKNIEDIIRLKRNYNSQKRLLISNADFLIHNYDKLVTEIDCCLLASSYFSIGDQEKAEYYWEETIAKSISLPIRHMNLRGYGIFFFENGEVTKGRQKFEEALNLKLTSNDTNNMMISDTYIMLAELEHDCKNNKNYNDCLTNAMTTSAKVLNVKRKGEMQQRIRTRLPK